MNDALVAAQDSSEEVWMIERCFIRERMNDAAVPEVSLADSRVEAGVTTQLHALDVKEWYVIRDGSGLMEVGGEEAFEVGPGDCVVIPAGVSQRITNTGSSDLKLQCVCMPRFTPECYHSLEEE